MKTSHIFNALYLAEEQENETNTAVEVADCTENATNDASQIHSMDIESNRQSEQQVEAGLHQIYNQMLSRLMVDTESSNNSYWLENRNDFRTAHNGGGDTDTDNNTVDQNNEGEDMYNDDYQEVTQDTYFYGGGASEEL